MSGEAGPAAWQDATRAAALLAVDPAGLKGIAVRAGPGPVRDRWLAALRRLLPPETPLRKLPPSVPDQRLLGGLDLAATLKAGRPIAERGLLAESDGGIVLVPMAERLAPGLAARLAATLDTGMVAAERDGLAIREEASLALVLLDEGAAEDEHPPLPLTERLALSVRLEAIALGDTTAPEATREDVARARGRLGTVTVPDALVEALCGTALALGIASLRAPLLALRAARAAAALAGRAEVTEEDAATAARLVLGPRATRLPPSAEQEPDEDTPDEAPEEGETPPPPPDDAEADETQRPDPKELADLVLAAALAAVPAGLLASLSPSGASRGAAASGKAGAARLSALRGAPIGARAGALGGGVRLALLETLRAAAPWQAVRRREGGPRIAVRREDFRVLQFRERSETTTIFVVDASGSSALNRLAEAKGAVELLLADCYVRRDRVALIAFRGQGAELLLPPTTSLVRARRSLAGLPGGGATPIAAGLDAARLLAEAVQRRGGTPLVVLLTDGRANVARSTPGGHATGGASGREAAEADALAAARALAARRVNAVLLDTSPRPQPQAARLAAALGARYLPLPYADAARLSRAVRAAQPGSTPAPSGRAA